MHFLLQKRWRNKGVKGTLEMQLYKKCFGLAEEDDSNGDKEDAIQTQSCWEVVRE